ncbi:MAG: class I adenylate cyclase [Candidatus Nitrospinota bacterium M3_3B_026]
MSRPAYARNRRAWRIYNDHRIERALQIDPEKGRVAFHVIPYLLSTNHPALPGYIEGEAAPGGIYLYTPGKETGSAVRRAFPEYDFDRVEATRGVTRLTVVSLLIMGSIGAVAQTKKSDYDYWVVVDESAMSPEELDALKAKLGAIKAWTVEKKIEAHFFISDVTRAKNNDFGETDKESAGSAQAAILKEEFYRTFILAAGKEPVWSALPPGLDKEEYEKNKEMMFDGGEVDEAEMVDLGAAEPIPMEELFGALLWQFNKAMESPHKSVLKMALIETFINAGPGAKLLCDILKGAVHGNPEMSHQADPYLLMFDYVHRGYLKAKRKAEAKTLEKCFFLKSFDAPVGGLEDDEGLPYKERTLRLLLRRWKWDEKTVQDMNGFSSWDFKKVAALASSLHNFMLAVYRRLTDRVARKPNVERIITDTDLTLLGRKLFTLYSKKPGKIEYLKRVMDELEGLDAVSFIAEIKHGRRPVWTVCKGNITSRVAKGGSVKEIAVKSAPDPVELLAWLRLNRVSRKNTFFYLIPSESPVSLTDLQELMDRITSIFPDMDLASLAKEDLLSRAVVERALVVVNFTTPRWESEVESLHVIYMNSWGEVYCHALSAAEGYSKLLDILLQTRENSFSVHDASVFDIYVPKGDNRTRLRTRISDFLMSRFLPRRPGAPRPR